MTAFMTSGIEVYKRHCVDANMRYIAKRCLFASSGSAACWQCPGTMRFGSTAKVLAKCKLKH